MSRFTEPLDRRRGYIVNCYIQTRPGDFVQWHPICLDGYAIIPIEEYQRLVAQSSRIDKVRAALEG